MIGLNTKYINLLYTCCNLLKAVNALVVSCTIQYLHEYNIQNNL